MDIQATKLEIIQLLLQTEEGRIFKKIKSIFKENSSNITDEIPSWQIKESAKRIENLKNGNLTIRDWDEAKSDIFS